MVNVWQKETKAIARAVLNSIENALGFTHIQTLNVMSGR